MSERVAYAVAHRLTAAAIPNLDPSWRGKITLGSPGLPLLDPHSDARCAFQLAFLGRMIFSALVDADRRDTEDHAVATQREVPKARAWPRLADRVEGMIAALDAHVAGLARPGSDPRLNAIRGRVLRAVTARAAEARGRYTLTVPTGGEKTLSSVRFALGHALRHRAPTDQPRGIDRIVIAIPFTTVTEQTSATLKTIFGDDLVLEHRSAIEREADEGPQRPREGGASLDAKLRWAMEDGAAPAVVTTNVQLFESLFSHCPSRCRKLHNLANSVIVLDEAQTLPRRLLRPCLAAVDELARDYGCTVVLCTATQPAVGVPDFAGGLELGPEQELAPDPAGLHGELRRATIRVEPVPMADEDLVTALGAVEQGFVIVNAHALALYRTAQRAGLDGLSRGRGSKHRWRQKHPSQRSVECDGMNSAWCRGLDTRTARVDRNLRDRWLHGVILIRRRGTDTIARAAKV